MIRLAHFSDVHITTQPLGWRPRDWFSKRILGYTNIHLLGRGWRFRHATKIADAMIAEIREAAVDQLIFSGDATKLGFDAEFAEAAKHLAVGEFPGFTVPGNHDYYTRYCMNSGSFERYFGAWQTGERIDHHHYPFARKVGHLWLIGVNSSHPQRVNIGASSTIGSEQLERLRRLCSQLDAGLRILVTHYPLRTAQGAIERRSHRLIDHRQALQVARECGIALWLHGHIHRGFVLPACAEIPFPVICAGSATQTGRWMYNHYAIEGRRLTMTRRVFDPEAGQFREAERYEIQLGFDAPPAK